LNDVKHSREAPATQKLQHAVIGGTSDREFVLDEVESEREASCFCNVCVDWRWLRWAVGCLRMSKRPLPTMNPKMGISATPARNAPQCRWARIES